MRLVLKPTVKLGNLQPQMIIALLCVIGEIEHATFSRSGSTSFTEDLMITAANDSGHKVGSKHFKGEAFDFKTKTLFQGWAPELRKTELISLQGRLAVRLPGFDVLMEDINSDNEHLHIEWDDKRIAAQATPLTDKV